MRKIFIHSPYWLTKGGGERYSLTAAESLADDFEVMVDAPDGRYLETTGIHLGIDLKRVKILPSENFMKNMSKFYGCFWVSDGSIPFLLTRKRVIHFQAPFKNIGGVSFKNKIKLIGVKMICNSFYTKEFVDKEFGVNSKVIYPPVEIEKFKPARKQNLILTVGRFSRSSQHKRPEVLVKAFKQMVSSGLKGWRMVVVGIVEDNESAVVATALRTLAKGFPVAIRTNLSHERLVGLYQQSAIYWHAAGFGVDLKKNPERAEHFGISVVEAMAAGAVPLVFAAGGPKEVVSDENNGFWWSSLDELKQKTLRLIEEGELREKLTERARQKSRAFSRQRFCEEIRELFL